MSKLARLLAIALAFTAVGLAPVGVPPTLAEAVPKPVLVFAAASLKTALDGVAKAWEHKTGTVVTLSFAGSPAIAKQLEAGAPADLVLSADLRWMDWLEERKLIDSGSRTSLLGNTLVLIAPKDSTVALKIERGFALAETLGAERLAMGDPTSVPAGTYGRAALSNLGVWDQVAGQVAGVENVRVALAYVARGEAPLGIVYGTDAKSDPGVRIVDTFPAGSHPPIIYPAALTAASTHPQARAFLDFLSSPEAVAVFEGQGFTVLK